MYFNYFFLFILTRYLCVKLRRKSTKRNERNVPRDSKGAEETLTSECLLTRCIIRRKLIKWLTTEDKKVLRPTWRSPFLKGINTRRETDVREHTSVQKEPIARESNANTMRHDESEKIHNTRLRRDTALDKIILSLSVTLVGPID